MSGLRGTADVLRRRMGLPVRLAWAERVFIAVDLVLGRAEPPVPFGARPRAWGFWQPALCRTRVTRPMVGRVR